MSDDLEITPPLKGLRRLMGTLALVTGLVTLCMALRWGLTVDKESLIGLFGGGLLVVAGTSMAFLERVVLVEVVNRKIRIAWRLCGLDLHSAEHDIALADRVVISTRKGVYAGTQVPILVADSFPVSLLAGREELIRVIGWSTGRSQGRFSFQFDSYSPADFISHSQYVAALLSTSLALPIECEIDGAYYPPNAVPLDWLDSTRVQAKLVWRKYRGRSR
jgi:hypothetical protein